MFGIMMPITSFICFGKHGFVLKMFRCYNTKANIYENSSSNGKLSDLVNLDREASHKSSKEKNTQMSGVLWYSVRVKYL